MPEGEKKGRVLIFQKDFLMVQRMKVCLVSRNETEDHSRKHVGIRDGKRGPWAGGITTGSQFLALFLMFVLL